MARGFDNPQEFAPVVGRELYQVTLDKFHVMFLFENGWQLLNVADSFSHFSSDGAVAYSYELYGSAKRLELDRLLRRRVVEVTVLSERQLALTFDNGDDLIVHDNPEKCSWWFMPIVDPSRPEHTSGWSSSDDEID